MARSSNLIMKLLFPVSLILMLLLVACQSTNDKVIADALQVVGKDYELSKEGQRVYKLRKAYLHSSQKHHSEMLGESIEYFYSLYEWSQVYRIRIKKLANQVGQHQGPLSGQLIVDLAKTNNDFVLLRQELYRLLMNHLHYRDNAYGEWSEAEDVKALCFNLAVTVTLYDNVSLSVSLLEKHSRVKHLFLNGSVDYDIPTEFNREIVKAFHSSRRRHVVREEMEKFNVRFKDLKVEEIDQETDYLASLIAQSPSAQLISQGHLMSDFSKSTSSRLKHYSHSLFNSHENVLFHLSKGFGNSLGLVATRKGYLHNDESALKAMKRELRPLDILLEKTPFRLTDKFIPGHFGHVAIYVGTEAELKALDLWNHPLIKSHQEDIRAGATVLEALREGVVLNPLEHFMNVDDVAILRRNKLNQDQETQYLLNAFRQLGKEYDFCFDVETLNRIVCSELVYQVFTGDNFSTEEALGRATISPDLVVNKAYENDDYQLILFYHEGKKITEDNIFTKVKSLMNEEE